MKKFTILALALLFFENTSAQQIPDTAFSVQVSKPAYPKNTGPIVLIDEGHRNFHTLDGRYRVFAKVLEADGYRLKAHSDIFSRNSLKDASILVVANAIHEDNRLYDQWQLPNHSAFSDEEIAVLQHWVDDGGSLFFIADHMPFAGAGEKLAKAFGFEFLNGFATDTTTGLFPGKKRELDLFETRSRTLVEHAITLGRSQDEQVHQVATFTGQAFRIPAGAHSLLTFDGRYQVLLPDTAWKFHETTARFSVKDLSQGAVLPYGKGKVAVFGEAAMFTAQLKGPNKEPFGLNSPAAKQNTQFLLNIIHWLDNGLRVE